MLPGAAELYTRRASLILVLPCLGSSSTRFYLTRVQQALSRGVAMKYGDRNVGITFVGCSREVSINKIDLHMFILSHARVRAFTSCRTDY